MTRYRLTVGDEKATCMGRGSVKKSAFPTSKHQKTSDLEVSDDLENLSVPTLWRISKFEEVLTQHKGELMSISSLCPKF